MNNQLTFFVGGAMLYGWWDISSPTKDQTLGLGIESTDSYSLNLQGIPSAYLKFTDLNVNLIQNTLQVGT